MCQRSATWTASGAPRLAALAYTPSRSRQMTSAPGVVGQPTDQRVRRRVLEQVDDMVPTTVDDNRAVAAPTPKSELVDPNNPRRLNRRLR